MAQYPPSYPPPQAPYPPPQGYYPPPPGYPQQAYGQKSNILAIFSLILGIIGIIGTCCAGFFACPLPLAAVITGHLAMSQINRNNEGGRGMAIAGLVMGYASIGLGLILLIISLVFNVAALGSGDVFSEIIRSL
jgi:hypothetical protein